ncbi:helix-turn-helix transcriptional regulator [Clostridium tagluense]|uniref:helix-turn-helix transcriptional regulator n=1 Tax=Clostridium tagluense TaxID=360422 RepID=UPI001C0D6937|nr:helix-turn-helix transcriptional regulator [Clostridium tagluense]MBU3126780.1 helix-turn-helix transcriptional regulator [Clostridium tagluense]
MNRIDEICKKRHISYSELGRLAGISSMYVGLLAKGKRKNPSLEVMQNISNALNEKVEKVFKVNVSIT